MKAQLQELVGRLAAWRIVPAVKIWSEVNMRYDAPSTLPLELAVVEICQDQAPAPPPVAETTAQPAAATRRSAPPRSAAPAASTARSQVREDKPAPQPVAKVQPQEAQPTPVAPMSGEGNDLAQAWAATVRALGRHKGKKYNLGALLRDCRPGSISLEGETLVLGFSHRTHMERMQEEMEDPKSRAAVSETINQFFDRPYELRLC